MKDDVSCRLNDLIERLELNQSKFCKVTGIKPQTLSKVCSGKNPPSFETLRMISEAYPLVNLRWLVTGKGRMFLDEKINTKKTFSKDVILKKNLIKKYLEEKKRTQDLEAQVMKLANEMLGE